MRIYQITIRLVFLVSLLMPKVAGTTALNVPFGTWLKPVETPSLAGSAILEFGINPRTHNYDTMVVKVKTIGNIRYWGPLSWVIRNDGSDQFKFNIEVMIPLLDTVGIEVELFVRGISVNMSGLHFVTTGDTLEISQFWPEPKEVRQWPIYVNIAGDTLDADSLREHCFDQTDPMSQYVEKHTTMKLFHPPTEQEIKDSLERERIQILGVDSQPDKSMSIFDLEPPQVKPTQPQPHWTDGIEKAFSPSHIPPIGVNLVPILSSSKNGQMILECQIRADDGDKTAYIKIETSGGLTYDGPKAWAVDLKKDTSFAYFLNVNIPQNDTSGIEVSLYIKGRIANSDCRYFVTTYDSLQIFKVRPKPVPKEKWPIFISHNGDTLDTDSVMRANHPQKNASIDTPYNYTYSTSRLSLPPTEQEIKDSLEREPLTKANTQFLQVDGEMWVRERGESKFRPALGTYDLAGLADSIMADKREKTKNDTIDVIFDLRFREDYDKVKRMVEKLLPMERTGYYRAKITREKYYQIKDLGIDIGYYPRYPGEKYKEVPAKPDDTSRIDRWPAARGRFPLFDSLCGRQTSSSAPAFPCYG